MFNNAPHPQKNHAIYAIMSINDAERGRPQMTIWCMCMACWITKQNIIVEMAAHVTKPWGGKNTAGEKIRSSIVRNN
jgi:hypothetical protein